MNFYKNYTFYLLVTIFSLNLYAQAKNDYNYNIGNVRSLPIGKRVILGGNIIPKSEINLFAQVSGDVIDIRGKEGDSFEKGDLMVLLEHESIRAQKDAAHAEIASANEILRNANVQYSKSIIAPYAESDNAFGGMPGMFRAFNPMQNLNNTDSSFDRYARRTDAYSHFAQARQRLRQAFAKLREIDEKLKDSAIRAPFDGVIISKNVDKGDTVQYGKELIKFTNIKELQVEINVPSRLVSHFILNNYYRIKLDSSNVVINAKLVQIYPIADVNNHTVKIKLDLPENLYAVPGSYAELELFEQGRNRLVAVIPDSALIWRSSLPSVFVVDSQNKTELRFIRVGEKINDDETSVLSGLKPGEKIIINPNILTVSGIIVN